MTDDPKQFSETVSTPVHDPDALERAGWTNAEVIWEQVQQAAEECDRAGDRAEAVELWRGAFDVACEHLDPRDLRLATSAANLGVAARRAGDRAAAVRRLDEALRLWDEGEEWLEALVPAARARSSTFHLRLESRHPGAYDRFPRERFRSLAREGRAVLAARRDGRPDTYDRLARWREERPAGFNDWRRLLAAVLLVAGDDRQ
ncbi:MAG: hypothetical protein OXC01_07770 [Immundisolibacterales bacterium]|nr:hypothetical protein [Immundisolibacterales bacterium]